MTPTAFQLPASEGSAREVGRRRFRKQALPVGTIKYGGRTLTFVKDGRSDPERDVYSLTELAANFRDGAMDQVPFVLADEMNKHTDDPDRFRGETVALQVVDDGLDAIIELTDDGAKVVRDNPKLGISPRLIGQRFDWGPRKVPAIAHLCGTLVPHNFGMRDWEAVAELAGIAQGSEMSPAYSASQVVDLTAATYEMPGTDATTTLTDEQKDKLKALGVPKDKYDEYAAIFAETGSEGKEADRTDSTSTTATTEENDDKKGVRALLKSVFGREPKDEEVDQTVRAVGDLAKPEEKDDAEKEKETAAADLSAEAKDVIDLANRTAASANTRADANDKELRRLRFKERKGELVAKGVDPATVDLCRPVLELPEDAKVIDLSAAGGEKDFNVREFVDKILEQHEGVVDLTADRGTTVEEVTTEDEERKRKLDEVEKRFPLGASGHATTTTETS